MGLDQYMNVRKPGQSDKDSQEIGYWRKHPDLQGFFENIWRQRPDASGDFNCVELKLSKEDILAAINATETRTLPHTEGFFFGASRPEDEQYTLDILNTALRYLADGYEVYYSSWW